EVAEEIKGVKAETDVQIKAVTEQAKEDIERAYVQFREKYNKETNEFYDAFVSFAQAKNKEHWQERRANADTVLLFSDYIYKDPEYKEELRRIENQKRKAKKKLTRSSSRGRTSTIPKSYKK
ncbi:MAG: hypothetical protein MJ072_05395, partial [Clostridia bacterium]|nr:hypothetical protein [Clostridia bacterium]